MSDTDPTSFAQKFTEDLLSFFGLNAVISVTADEERIYIDIPSTHINGFLIGQHGDTMQAMQTLISYAVYCNFPDEDTRVNLDIAGYKKQAQDKVKERAKAWIKQVQESGEPLELEPMNSAHRRVVHQLVSDEAPDLTTISAGEGRDRHVVIQPIEP